ncbi:site-2 protease family protein [Reichenbachiella agarivorans]|uniref:Site-2 protease family protein n=1 Tax=Reichenbachiella agarivorans TaxID=2979464 RepID=A0ABY6CKP4_9BACT|nr:site-2 protease family protein [Reichenbachiella agarivorans]UXP31082.1 site-2 protease family protein [Reichenbachiella agarivorans]
MSDHKSNKQLYIQISLFILTIITTTISGAEWISGKSLLFGEETVGWTEFMTGFTFSIPFLLILTVHEFGHYFTAQYHKVKVTLPYYIPLWLGFIGSPSIGTMGAFIKIKERVDSRKKYFDIGIAGPLAGFVVAFFVIWYGFATLPSLDYIYQIHPEYEQWGENYAEHAYDEGSLVFVLGPNLLFSFFENYVVSDPKLIPHAYEMIHYPYLFAGYLALFFTALNLLPIGQLDGGHILYGLIGPTKHRLFSKVFFLIFVYYAGLGIASPYQLSNWMMDEALYVGFLYLSLHHFSSEKRERLMYALGIFAAQLVTVYFFPLAEGYTGWLLFSFILGRVMGIYHPPVLIDTPLNLKRKVLGWMALVVFVLCFSPKPFDIVETQSKEDKSATPTIRSETNPSPY